MHDLRPNFVEETEAQNPLEFNSRQRWEITQDSSCTQLILAFLQPIKILNAVSNCVLPSFFLTEGYHIRKFKRYLDNPSVPVPKSTKFDREQAFSNTFHGERSHLDSSICRRRSSVVNRVKCVSNICTRPRRDYVRLQRRFGILAHKWMHTVGSLPKLRKWCWKRRHNGYWNMWT